MTDSDSNPGRPPSRDSDFFAVDGSVESIPTVEKVLLPPEEIRKQRIRWALGALLVAILVGLATQGILHLIELSETAAAVEAAADGRPATIAAALERIDEGERPALAARLLGQAALTGATSERIAALIARVDPSIPEERLEARIAGVYLGLATRDLAAALENASAMRAAGEFAAEVAYAKALTGLAVGDLEHARAMASQAVELRPSSPRHVALLALVAAEDDDHEGALTLLQRLPSAAQSRPEILAARARILLRDMRDPEAARAAADAVLGAEGATEVELSWAHLVRARLIAEAGDRSGSVEEAALASARLPPGDDAFTLVLVQTYLRAGALDHAAEARAAFPSSYSTDPALRSQVDAWLALSRGELTQAATALQTAGDARAGDLLRGWLSEASRDTERARAFYRRAAQDSRLLPRAHTRLARMELRLGRERDAVTVMASVLEQTQNHPEFVPVAIEANLAVGDLARARALSDTLIAAHPNDPRVLIARAHVHMAAEEWEQAARHLETAVQSRPSDADAQANLGRAAQHLGRREQAEEAFRAALAIEARLPDALLGLLELYIEAEEADHAEPILEEIDAAALRSERVDLLRSRFLVLAGKGHGGVLAMRAILRRRPRSSELRMNMAELYMQAGLFTQAARQFEAATGFGADEREAAVGIGLAQILAKRNRIAEVALERVRALELAAGGPQSGSAEVRARTLVLVGHLSLYGNHISPAREAALEALELQPECVEAHMLLAAIAEKRGADPSEHWRAAAAGSRPAPAAIGHMARAAGIGDEGCRLARQYVRAAPRGDLAEAMREMQRDCRRR